MADDIDRANDTAELYLQVARANMPAAVPTAGIGVCINCGVDVEGDRRWCDTDCLADWEERQHRGK